jgi:hypothetical protein
MFVVYSRLVDSSVISSILRESLAANLSVRPCTLEQPQKKKKLPEHADIASDWRAPDAGTRARNAPGRAALCRTALHARAAEAGALTTAKAPARASGWVRLRLARPGFAIGFTPRLLGPDASGGTRTPAAFVFSRTVP